MNPVTHSLIAGPTLIQLLLTAPIILLMAVILFSGITDKEPVIGNSEDTPEPERAALSRSTR